MAVPLDNFFEELVHSSSLSLHEKALFTTWANQVKTNLKLHSDREASLTLLNLIPVCPNSELLRLASLALLVSQYQGEAHTFDTIRYSTQLWTELPESIKAGHDENSRPILERISHQIAMSVENIPSLLNSESLSPVLYDPISQRSLAHKDLATFIREFRLPLSPQKDSTKPVIALALPNGYLLGLAVLTIASYYTAAPINIAGGASQFQSDAKLAKPQCILVLESDMVKLGLTESWVEEAGIQILLIQQTEDMTFQVRSMFEDPQLEIEAPTPNVADDLALILFTSGTTGTKKVVPTTCFGLINSISCVIDSWGLTPTDTCLNMMPLNHVGGIVRNLFAPVLSGGSTILCPAFDPNLFWDILEDDKGSWYYASPSMHMAILAEGSVRGESVVSRCNLRLVCNAAGGLLPALAVRLRDTFNCTVLPSYGMTECMPISTPPLDYKLDRVGTSGLGCGPEIAILDESGSHLPAGQVGHISVRGGPVFPGYLKKGKIDKSAFNSDGWFDTGDLGLLDQEGYLYLTGRGKEVINRGGEIISPFEVEEAITIASQDSKSLIFGRVQQVLAFSAPHDVLQEVVGVAIVTPSGKPRPDMRDLHAVLKPLLHSSKWPMVIVYMDALPTSNNKLVRIKFSDRMDMATLTNEMKLIERHFEAVCPPVNSALITKISSKVCSSNLALVLKEVELHIDAEFEAYVGESHHDGSPIVYLAPTDEIPETKKSTFLIEPLRKELTMALDGFLMPSQILVLEVPFPRDTLHNVDISRLDMILREMKNSDSTPAASETEEEVRRAFAELLGFEVNEISSESDFFEMGGDSMSAGQLLSIIRRNLGVRIPVDQLFTSPKVSQLCALIDEIRLASSENKASTQPRIGCTKTHSSTNPLLMMIHLFPIVIFYPMKLGFQWTALMYALSSIAEIWDEPNTPARFLALVGAMFISRAATQVVAPIVGITMKWLIIGTYSEGMYPMWGMYHTRWWLVEKILQICGKGVFRHLDATRILYYRLLGAKIGKNVTIERGTTLGEFDLLDIGDNVYLDRCICRPFAAEINTSMYLGRIVIGKNSSVGLKTHVAAGSIIPEDTFIGANSASYEMDDIHDFPRAKPAKPHFLMQLFVIIPVQVFVLFVSSLPWMFGLFGIVIEQKSKDTNNVKAIITWWATPRRIMYHYIAQVLHVSVRPFIWFTLVLLIKMILNKFCGVAKPMLAENRTSRDNFRSQLMSAIVPHGSLKSLTKLFGAHYEATSIAVRTMGGKVGRRVYWPGTGPSIEDFDLIDIGDDVVFGSRSHLVTSDATGSDLIRIENGAMIADRVILNPGTRIGPRAVIGSGALIQRNKTCDADTVWVGNRNGSALCLSTPVSSASSVTAVQSTLDLEKASFTIEALPQDSSTSLPSYDQDSKSKSPTKSCYEVSEKELSDSETKVESKPASIHNQEASSSTPFGRAFYEGKAPYFVFSQFSIFLYSTFIAIFVQVYWNVGTISTIILSQILHGTDQFHPHWYRPMKLYCFAVSILSALYILLALLSLTIVVAAKWILLGRRKPGSYDWDKSSYCQRWQLFLTIEAIRRRCFGGNGILGLLTGTHFCVLYFRALGAKIGKDCALFAGGRPSLMFTEPDLLDIGDRVSTDDASLVGHINSRGHFSLNKLSVGSRSVLRSGSRLLSGASMGCDTILLEHTLVMAGDVADDGVVYQGWPANVYNGDRLNVSSKRS